MAKRNFRFAARVLEHLGAELISSDDVAIYELVKNGFDAATNRNVATTVTVAINFHLSVATIAHIRKLLTTHFSNRSTRLDRPDLLALLKRQANRDEVPALFDDDAIARIAQLLPPHGLAQDFQRALSSINSISVSDHGVGMSATDLEKYFLTIGTGHRLEDHRLAESGSSAPGFAVTGEKGIGRLSMMRLGLEAMVRTRKVDERRVNVLSIDWRNFIGNGDAAAQDIEVDLRTETAPSDFPASGTTIEIADLTSDWPLAKAEEVGAKFLSKFLDPFRNDKRRRVVIKWNNSPVNIPRVGGAYLAAAPNGMKASVNLLKDRKFAVAIDYWFTTDAGVRKEYNRTYTSFDFGGIDGKRVAAVGPFELEMYHFNRRRLAAIPGVASREEVREWLDEWCGGLKLYRDGVRVMPYGQGDSQSSISRTYDDWLDLDAKALRGRGFRVNRIQVVGCVRISRIKNAMLRDQANREGLMDNDASQAFVTLLKEILRRFVAELDAQVRPTETDLSQLHDAAIRVQDEFEIAVNNLITAAGKGDKVAISNCRNRMNETLKGVRAVLDDTQLALEDRQLNRIEVLELAATGVAAESFAHDLEATLDQALEQTAGITSGRPPANLDAAFAHIRSVFKSLRVQISIIKPGPAKYRRRRTDVDLLKLLGQVERFYAGRFERHKIVWRLIRRPKDTSLIVFAVEGHVRQVIDNLARNSIYWLKETRAKEPTADSATITVTVDSRSRTLLFEDSGVGIAAEDVEWIFGRFHSHRHGGRGLGLYLSKELCDFNGIGLTLDSSVVNQWKRLNRFILDFSACRPQST